MLDLCVERRIHVHGDSLDTLAALFAQGFKEGAQALAAASRRYVEHSARIGIQDHAGVAMPLEHCKLIHDQTLRLRWWQAVNLLL